MSPVSGSGTQPHVPLRLDVSGPEALATCPLMSSYESALEKASSSRFLIYMTFTLQSRVWLGLSALLAGVYLTDESWRDADASLTGLKGTMLQSTCCQGRLIPPAGALLGPAGSLRPAGHGGQPAAGSPRASTSRCASGLARRAPMCDPLRGGSGSPGLTPAHLSAETSYLCEQEFPRRSAGVEGLHFHSRDILLDPRMETP